MDSRNWNAELHGARDAGTVLQVVRRYLASWTPLEIASLPAECKPWPLREPDDISAFAVHLVHQKCRGDGDRGHLLASLTNFFADASARLVQVLSEARAVRTGAFNAIYTRR